MILVRNFIFTSSRDNSLTKRKVIFCNFAVEISTAVQKIHSIAFTHKKIGITDIGRYHLSNDIRFARLKDLKQACNFSELMYLSTCNRVEFLFVCDAHPDSNFLHHFFQTFLASTDEEEIQEAVSTCQFFSGEAALKHLFRVASSLDSLVVGEREIITQVRTAFEACAAAGLTGDIIRLTIRKTIETAKTIYTQTDIARNPVSVVSLAWRKLRELNVPSDARFLLIGAGVTNTAMARYLHKHGFRKFCVFNRTFANAEQLAAEIGGNAYALNELQSYRQGFDVIVTCTGAQEVVLTSALYRHLLQGDRSRKVVIDLAVPNDLDPAILTDWDVNLIAVSNLQEVARENLRGRENQLDRCQEIILQAVDVFHIELKARRVELAMRSVPEKVKEIRETALSGVFAREVEQLDPSTKELLDKVLNYVEKKYISVPMKMAREILVYEANRT
jgi:glutamyl-tRNA reductase